MYYFFLILLATLPSFIWLFYYLKKDIHPEPKKLIFYVFIVGALFAVLGYFFQRASSSFIFSFVGNISVSLIFISLFYRFIIIAFSEELLKYLAFFFTVRGHIEIDEPVDFIIYMITAGLGFAALENFIILSSLDLSLLEIVKVSALRFVSGTLLHALVSGIMGGFLLYSCRLNKKSLLFLGLFCATLFHGIYNLLAEKIGELFFLILFLLFFFLLSLMLSSFIKEAKKMKSISFSK